MRREDGGQKWTAQELAILRRRWMELYHLGIEPGQRALMIMRDLPGRSRSQIYNKATYPGMRLPNRCPKPGGAKS